MIMRSVFIVFIVLTVAVSALAEEDKLYYIGINTSYIFQHVDEEHSKDALRQPIDVSFDNSWGLKARAGMDINEYLAAETMLEYVHPFEDTAEDKENTVNAINLSVNAKLILLYKGSFMPYLYAGTGAMTSREEIKYRDEDYSKISYGISARIGAGTEMFITPYVSAILELDHVFCPFGDTSHVRYTNLSFGMSYYF